MAVTKTHPIKSTLKAAIDYICNPDKTDGKLLVSSFGCAAETADIEFEWTRRHSIDKGTHLGRHLIQAFEPGEVSAEEAHEIGMQLAKEILGGKYEFVLTTHIDKGHIHNHLIFNAVSFTDHKHYHSNKRSYRSGDLLPGHAVDIPKPEDHPGLAVLYGADIGSHRLLRAGDSGLVPCHGFPHIRYLGCEVARRVTDAVGMGHSVQPLRPWCGRGLQGSQQFQISSQLLPQFQMVV